jgi:outer membrane protein assembly factor BamA
MAAALLVLLAAPAAWPQQTRAEVIAEQQAAKAKALAPYDPNPVEQLFERIETGGWFTGAAPRGIYPVFGSIYPGGSLTGGVGYRKYVGYNSFVDMVGMYSAHHYKQAELSVVVPQLARNRVDVGVRAGWRDATRVPYFGLGVGSTRADRAAFRLNQAYADVEATARPLRRVALGASLGYQGYDEREPQGRHPAIDARFDAVTAPKLGAEPAYIRTQVSAALFWLESVGYSRRGGRYQLTYQSFEPTRGGGGTFGLVRSDVVQHIPVLRETWVVSLRARTESVTGDSDNAPYFMLPYLGSGSTLRGYSTGRFRDRHAVLFTGEWRSTPNRLGLDVALFADAGTVAPTFGDISMRDMKMDAGIGVRFHSPAMTVLRVDVARGTEGWRTIFSASSPF